MTWQPEDVPSNITLGSASVQLVLKESYDEVAQRATTLETQLAESVERERGLEWTTDWFDKKGVYLISGSSLGIVLVDYIGGNAWFISGKQHIGMNADTKANWVESRDIMGDPIYRTVIPVSCPHWQADTEGKI